MTGSLTIKHRFYISATLTAVLVTAIAGVGLWGVERQKAVLHDLVVSNGALRSHMEADMMHDALRGDVLAAMRLGVMTPAGEQEAIRADLAEHVALFRSSVEENQHRSLHADTQAALDAVIPSLTAYIAAAQSIVDAAFVDPAAANAEYGSFGDAFTVLEADMAAVSDRIEASAVEAESAAAATSALARAVIGGAGLLTFALLALSSILMIRSIVRPLDGLSDAMAVLAAGDIAHEVPSLSRGDEIGRMAKALQVFKEAAIREREQMAVREREQAAMAERAGTVERLCSGFDRKVAGVLEVVRAAVAELQSTAGTMSSTAAETTRQATTVAAASDQATANVQTVASAAEELSTSVTEISRQVTQSAEIAGKAVAEAAATNERVRSLAEAAQKIGDVVNLINDIAAQTNLLALNATIEAARAGEAGKGFAVVANEVKSLANQTAKATEEIGAQIGAIQGSTESAVGAIGGISSTIREINDIAAVIAAAVEEQGAATHDIASNVQQAATGTQQVSSSIAGVSQAASEAGGAADQLLDSARSLAVEADRLRDEVTGFLEAVRAA